MAGLAQSVPSSTGHNLRRDVRGQRADPPGPPFARWGEETHARLFGFQSCVSLPRMP